MIPYSRQQINKLDIKNVNKVLTSNFLTTGPEVDKFERKLNSFCGSKHAVVTSSASASLHIACLALGLKKKRHCLDITNNFCFYCKCCFTLWSRS